MFEPVKTCMGMFKGFQSHNKFHSDKVIYPLWWCGDVNDLSASIFALTSVWMAKHSMCHHSSSPIWWIRMKFSLHASSRGPRVTDKTVWELICAVTVWKLLCGQKHTHKKEKPTKDMKGIRERSLNSQPEQNKKRGKHNVPWRYELF